jgi:hypothetical protein
MLYLSNSKFNLLTNDIYMNRGNRTNFTNNNSLGSLSNNQSIQPRLEETVKLGSLRIPDYSSMKITNIKRPNSGMAEITGNSYQSITMFE